MRRLCLLAALSLLACDEDDCPTVACVDSMTVTFEGGGLLGAYTVVLTDEDARQVSFKCFGREERELSDDTISLWCEDEGFQIAGWKMAMINIAMSDQTGSYEWEKNPIWEDDHPYGEDCPAACAVTELTLTKEAPIGDSG